MKEPKFTKNVKVHPYALRDIKEISIIDDKIAGKIVQRIAALGVDPKPDNNECNSKVVQI